MRKLNIERTVTPKKMASSPLRAPSSSVTLPLKMPPEDRASPAAIPPSGDGKNYTVNLSTMLLRNVTIKRTSAKELYEPVRIFFFAFSGISVVQKS